MCEPAPGAYMNRQPLRSPSVGVSMTVTPAILLFLSFMRLLLDDLELGALQPDARFSGIAGDDNVYVRNLAGAQLTSSIIALAPPLGSV